MCQERHETAPPSVSEHRSPDSACDDSGKEDLHINGEVDLPESDNDDLILLARLQQEKPPPKPCHSKDASSRLQTSGTTQARRDTYADSVIKGHRQTNNKRFRSASLTTTQPDSAMICGNGKVSRLRSTNLTRRGATPKARKQVGIVVTRLARSTKPKDLVTHVNLETGLLVSCEPRRTKFDTYASLCIRFPSRDRHLLLDPKLWPSGVNVRGYFEWTFEDSERKP